MNFSENLERLDEAMRLLEDGSLPLDEALSVFERGVALLRESRAYLNEAEQKVTLLMQDGGEVPFARTVQEEE